ncbi:hypothetical protein SAMN06295912_101287 [Sphingomonas laterariae]|uniref:Uncharacterized protein n=1 Tax=Edaphosphingomonas laterariae TaxID=861865 RepID=A0A239BMG5_9SPHN|nr:hypothetical protein [Sphingomonas laterariae]SNS09160.1 hypothetical protein SAMN06295912_101287 [Sphingomonas laterariae]
MALAALISAYKLAEEETEGLRATLPLAGRTLVEHQARLAAFAGAEQILILAERVPVALAAAAERLRRAGLRVDITRDIADAADRIHPEEKLLVFGDGCLAPPRLVERMAETRAPTLLTVPDEPELATFERMDATARWGGLMLIDGGLLRGTAAMLGDWDLESTLLRRAVQGGAERLDAMAGNGRQRGKAPLLADGVACLAGYDRDMLSGARPRGRDWPWRHIFPRIEKLVAPPLLRRGTDPVWFAVAAVTAAVIAGIFFAVDWRLAGQGALMFSGPIAAVAERLAGARLSPLRWARGFLIARTIAATAALLVLTYGVATEAGWGMALVTAILLGGMAALAGEQRILRALPGGSPPLWIASLDALIWAMTPFALIGHWAAGLAGLALYAVASFAAVQREVADRVMGRTAPPPA